MRIFSLALIMACLSGCSNTPDLEGCNTETLLTGNPDDVVERESLQGLTQKADTTNNGAVSAMRIQMLRDAAMSVGARGGLAYRGKQVNAQLMAYEQLLYQVFNFNLLLLDDNILPPVLIEGQTTLQVAGETSIRIADRNYQILSQAKFVTAAPIWRDYLWMRYEAPERPHDSLLPKNRAEQIIWKRYINEGWQAGVKQADLIIKESIQKLYRDYHGMIRYRILLAQNMVSPPYVAKLDLGVTGSGQDMTINDRVLTITALPQLQIDSAEWKAEISTYE